MSAEDSRRVRGWLLRLLERMPLGESDGGRMFTDADALTSQLRAAHVRVLREQAERELAYLAGKGYVELAAPKRNSPAARILGEVVAARLTSKGQDLIDGSIDEDRGVEMPGRWS